MTTIYDEITGEEMNQGNAIVEFVKKNIDGLVVAGLLAMLAILTFKGIVFTMWG